MPFSVEAGCVECATNATIHATWGALYCIVAVAVAVANLCVRCARTRHVHEHVNRKFLRLHDWSRGVSVEGSGIQYWSVDGACTGLSCRQRVAGKAVGIPTVAQLDSVSRTRERVQL